MKQTYYRHGDVHIIPVAKIPKDANPTKEVILEEGELTGHAHRLSGGEFTILRTNDGVKFLHVGEETEVTHEEHHTRSIPPGEYEIRRTRETDHMAGVTRQVAD
jgi:hypothetical protein